MKGRPKSNIVVETDPLTGEPVVRAGTIARLFGTKLYTRSGLMNIIISRRRRKGSIVGYLLPDDWYWEALHAVESETRRREPAAQTPVIPGFQIRMISEDEARRHQEERKIQLGLQDWNELQRTAYPTYFTATFDYFATGEGRTMGVSMHCAHSYHHLRECISEDFGPYFGPMAEVALGLVALPIAEELLPSSVLRIMDELNGEKAGRPCNFSFTAQLHENYA